MASVSSRSTPYDTDYPVEDVRSGSGWLGFAAIMLGIAGAWNVFDGILAIANSKVYAKDTTFVFSDLRTWGWIVLIVGALQIVAACTLFNGNAFARWFGVGIASINAIGQLMFVPAAPFWALSMFTIDLLIIYGLVVYGGRPEEAA
jgi:hypothetical protein